MPPLPSLLGPALFVILAIAVGVAARRRGNRTDSTLGAVVTMLIGLTATGLVTYLVLYLLALIGGFYESLTCKVVSIPSCEDPLALPGWLRLPAQSVGGVMGVLPLLAVFLAKLLQPRARERPIEAHTPLRERLVRQGLAWLGDNLGIILILGIELWLAALRGSAEASDRQVRLALGLDQDLPAAYLSVARWGAVVLALGLSAVMLYLGILARSARLLLTDALGELGYGARLVELVAEALRALTRGLEAIWIAVAIAVGRLALKVQSGGYRLWVLVMSSLGRVALKTQSLLLRSWAFVATTLGWTVLWFARPRRPGRRTLYSLVLVGLLGGLGVGYTATYVVLIDATGSEEGRLETTLQKVLAWADPSPERALLERGDRLIVIPVLAPGNLNPTYSAVFNAVYPSNQLDRYTFFTSLRDTLPRVVDGDPGTDLSEAMRAAAFYLEDAEDERVLVVFGNGEDHAERPITPGELAPALAGASVVHLNLGRDYWSRWEELYRQVGVGRVLLMDLAGTRSLLQRDLQEALGIE